MNTGGRITAGRWFSIGIFRGSSPLTLAPAPEVSNPVLTYRHVSDVSALFVADPFLARHEGLWYLFFEILNEATYKGEIGVAVSENARDWEYRGRVLVEAWNVSYPHVFRTDGQWYMVPEMYGQNCVRLYRAEAFPTDWRPVADLIEAGPVADPTPFRWAGRWWMLTCSKPATHDELRLYSADRIEGPWREHPASPIVRDDPHGARPAGRVVRMGQRLLRFAQDCHPCYGKAIRAFEITRLTPTEYAEVPLEGSPVVEPSGEAWNAQAMHHVDAHQLADGSWVAAVDGHDHPEYVKLFSA